MKNSSRYLPFDTAIRFETLIKHEKVKRSVQPSLLSNASKKALIEQACTWRDGTKLKKGSSFYVSDGALQRAVTLENSIIKIENTAYVIHHGTFAAGAEGKIKVLERLTDGAFCLVKIQSISASTRDDGSDPLDEVRHEVESLQDAGLCQGQTQRIRPSQANVLDYSFKHYVIMPHLGRDLRTHLDEQDKKQAVISDAVRFEIAIQVLWELTKLHLGLLFISGDGRMHRDLKPANIVLSSKGVRAIDFGFSERMPERLVYPNMGTIPYLEFPFDDFMRTCYHNVYQFRYTSYDVFYEDCESSFRTDFVHEKRSGVFFDMEAMRRTLYGPLCYNPRRPAIKKLGILSPSLVTAYELERYFDRGYFPDSTKYLDEEQLKIKDAMTLTAVLIASQVRLSHEVLEKIIAHADLAATVVGTYFSNQTDWLSEGKARLYSVLALSSEVLRQSAAFVRLGLSHALDKGLKNQVLCDVLNSHASTLLKRTVVCLFQSGLWDKADEVLVRLTTHSTLPLRCIEAYIQDDMHKLCQLVSSEEISEEATPAYACDDLGMGAEINRAFTGFTLRPEDLNKLKEHKNMITWFHQKINAISPRDALNEGAMLHACLVNPIYQEALVFVYDVFFQNPGYKAERLLHALTCSEGLDAAHMIVGLKSMVSLQRLSRLCERKVFVSNRRLFEKHPKLTMHDFLRVLEEGDDPRLLMKTLLHIKDSMSRIKLERLMILQRNSVLFDMCISQHGDFKILIEEKDLFKKQTTEVIVNYILTHADIAPYFFEQGDEVVKVRVLAACLADGMLWMKPGNTLQHDVFFKAAVVLARSRHLTRKNLCLLTENNTGFDLGYVSLILFMIKMKEIETNPIKLKTSFEALIKLYQALDTIKHVLGEEDVLGKNILFVKKGLNSVFACMTRYAEAVSDDCSETFFLEQLKMALMRLDNFATDPRCIAALQKVRLDDSNTACGRWGLFACLTMQTKYLSASLRDITSSINVLKHNFDMVSDAPMIPGRHFLSAQVHILA